MLTCILPAPLAYAQARTQTQAPASAYALKPGEYISEGGVGSLTLKSGKKGALRFAIEAVGANGHTCSLEGELNNGRAKLDAMEEKNPCVVTMTPTAEGIAVKGSESGSCSYYCGLRATFEAVYFQPAPACINRAIAAARKSFKQLYDAKKFAEARGRLEPILKDCSRSLHWMESGRIRNDLAVTLHKLGDLAGCQAVLQTLAEEAKATDSELQEKYPPTDLESYMPVVRSTRTNLKLCKGK
jgi:hypothetical protein